MVKIVINDVTYDVPKEFTVLQACEQAGIDIPTLCNDDRLVAHAACRMCVVEVEGMRNLMTACSLKVSDGMKVQTHSPKVVEARRYILDLLMSNHPNDCLTCEKSGECKLQDYCYEYGVEGGSFVGEKRDLPPDESNEFYDYDRNKCILCGRCVRVCEELQCTSALTIDHRGFGALADTPFRAGRAESTCVSCGNCVAVCPVGALLPKREKRIRSWDTKKVKTTCTYCGVGCQLELITHKGKVIGSKPVEQGEPNHGLLCVKGSYATDFINHEERLKTPLIRKNGVLEEASWDAAFNLIVSKIKETKEKYGPDSLGGFTSARCTNEDNYLFQKLFRAVIGTNNIDHCARL